MRIHSDARRAEAIGLGLALGADEAAKRTGIARRTISRWLADPRRVEEAVDPTTHEAIVGKLWEAVTVGTDAVLAGLRDPRARLGDKARALEIVSERHALLTGHSTANIAYSEAGARDPDHVAEQWLADLIADLPMDEKARLAHELDTAQCRILEDFLVRNLAPIPEATQRWFDAHKSVPQLGDGRDGT
jgi:hypothetical protein